MNDWVLEIEAVLGIEHVDGRGWHGWRRAFARLFELWPTNTRLKNLITGREQLLPTTHGKTRQKVYLDHKDLRLLTAAHILCEHVRTGFARTGEGPDVTSGSGTLEEER